MATLNSVSFDVEAVSIRTVNKQDSQDIPSTADQQISEYGYSGLAISVSGAVYTLADADSLLDELLKQGNQTLVLESGMHYDVYTVSYTMSEPFDVQEDYFRFDMEFVTESPYHIDDTEITRAKTITTQGQTWSQDDSANDISTDGSADTIPDIKLAAGNLNIEILTQDQSDDGYAISNDSGYITLSQTTWNSSIACDSTNSPGQTILCRKIGAQVLYKFNIYVNSTTPLQNSIVYMTIYDKPGGTQLDQWSILVTGPGLKTFTFSAPFLRESDEADCSDVLANKVYMEITNSTYAITLRYNSSDVYSDGRRYHNGAAKLGDLYFEVIEARPVVKVEQTFQLTAAQTVFSVILKLCKYQYTGSNPVTVNLKEGATTLGSATAVLSGSSYSEVTFVLTPTNPGDLYLAASTTYTLEITPPSDSVGSTCILLANERSNVYANGSVTLTDHLSATYTPTHDIYFKLVGEGSLLDVDVYNNADSSRKCRVADMVQSTAEHRINEDGTGTVTYEDDFTTNKYLNTSTSSGVTYDDLNDELDIADNGYIYWKFVTSPYAARNHPDLTATIDITAGTPTIQISEDGSTWYDIDTAIVDNVSTTYDLKSTGNLTFTKKSTIYFRIDCTATGTHTCSLKTMSLSIGLQTIDALLPYVNHGGSANTFKCDQHTGSGIDCTVTLYYHDLKWAG